MCPTNPSLGDSASNPATSQYLAHIKHNRVQLPPGFASKVGRVRPAAVSRLARCAQTVMCVSRRRSMVEVWPLDLLEEGLIRAQGSTCYTSSGRKVCFYTSLCNSPTPCHFRTPEPSVGGKSCHTLCCAVLRHAMVCCALVLCSLLPFSSFACTVYNMLTKLSHTPETFVEGPPKGSIGGRPTLSNTHVVYYC